RSGANHGHLACHLGDDQLGEAQALGVGEGVELAGHGGEGHAVRPGGQDVAQDPAHAGFVHRPVVGERRREDGDYALYATHCLTPPAAMPWTRWRSRNANSRITGTMKMSEAAMISFHCTWYCWLKEAMPMGPVQRDSPDMSVAANTNSPQVRMAQ